MSEGGRRYIDVLTLILTCMYIPVRVLTLTLFGQTEQLLTESVGGHFGSSFKLSASHKHHGKTATKVVGYKRGSGAMVATHGAVA